MISNAYNPNPAYNNQALLYNNPAYANAYAYNNPYLNNNSYQVNPAYMTQQQRLQALEQQYPQYSQTMPPPIQNQPIQQQEQVQQSMANNQLVSITVNSEDEARKYMPDMTGAVQTFIQKENGKVIRFFSKQINDELEVDFNTYEKVEKKINNPIIKEEEKKEEKSELLITIQNNIQSLDDKVNDLKSLYNKIDDLNLEILGIKEALRDELSTKQEYDKSSSSKSTRSSTSGK